MDMWYLILAIGFLAVVFYVFFFSTKKNDKPVESYVCDVCGEHHCICRKEEDGTQQG
jgi:hypothetical protein